MAIRLIRGAWYQSGTVLKNYDNAEKSSWWWMRKD